jgi:cysteine desulfurase
VAKHAVTSAVEHSALLHACASLADGWRTPDAGIWKTTTIPVDRDGTVDAADYTHAVLNEPTAFAVLQAANGEVGTRQPLHKVAEALHGEVPLLVDGSAALGEPRFSDLPWDVLTASAAHLGAPAATAALAIRTGVRWRAPERPTDSYELGWVPGQPNIAHALAFATALEVAAADSSRSARLNALTEHIRTAVPQLISDCVVVGSPTQRVSHLVTMSFLYVSGSALAAELDDAGFAVASGSACASDALTPSHVLAAMGALTEGNIRVSLPSDITDDQVSSFLDALPECVARVRAKFGAPA